MDDHSTTRSPHRVVESLGDRLGVAPRSVVVAGVAIAAAAIGGWWALRAPDPPPPEEVLPRAAEAAALVPPTTTSAPIVLVVHIDGAVVEPGVHELALDARVVDAIDAAGGLSADADRSRLNLAEPLGDGQRVWVPAIGEEEPGVVEPSGGIDVGGAGSEAAGGQVDLNAAGPAELEALPGIGPSIAAAIIDHRAREGPFRTIDDLLDVAGIGPARLAQLETLVTV